MRIIKKNCKNHYFIIGEQECIECLDCGRLFFYKPTIKKHLLTRYGKDYWTEEYKKLTDTRSESVKGIYGANKKPTIYTITDENGNTDEFFVWE